MITLKPLPRSYSPRNINVQCYPLFNDGARVLKSGYTLLHLNPELLLFPGPPPWPFCGTAKRTHAFVFIKLQNPKSLPRKENKVWRSSNQEVECQRLVLSMSIQVLELESYHLPPRTQKAVVKHAGKKS
jgi:hypothetical protein